MASHQFDSLTPSLPKNKLAPTPKNKPRFSVKVKNLKNEEVELADPKATRALVALMNQHAIIGGAAAHWGGPSAFAEMMSSVHHIMFSVKNGEWYDHFNFINDAGHAENGIYALRANYSFDKLSFDDLKKFRSIESKLTGHGESHLNPEGVFISNGPLGSGLPQAQGLALADKILKKDRVTICAISDGASMEGEAKESFAAIPGLASKGQLNPFVMLISDNNTKLSGRIDSDSFSMTPTFRALETLGWKTIYVEDGHNLESVHQSFERALDTAKTNPNMPVAVVYKTIKGKGVKSTEDSKSGGHGYPLKPYDEKLEAFIQEIYDGKAPEVFTTWVKEIHASKKPSSPKSQENVVSEKVQVGLSKAANRAAKENFPVFSVSSDLAGSTGIADFQKNFPGRWVDVGVAEANMISTAIGLSKQGLIPFVDTFAQFGVTKGNLPLTMAGLSQAPVIGLFSHTGFQDAADGASHQATTYFSATASIPYTSVISVASSSEAEFFLYSAIKEFDQLKKASKQPNSYLFFYGRENFPQHYGDANYTWNQDKLLVNGSDVLLVATGPTVPLALKAAELLAKTGVKASVLNRIFVNGGDLEFVAKQVKNCQGRVVTVEDHQVVGGMGSLLISSLAQKGISLKSSSLGIAGHYGQSAYLASQLYERFGLSETHIVNAAKTLL